MAAIDVNLGNTHCIIDLGERHAFMQIKGHWTGSNAAKLGNFFTKAVSKMRGQVVLSLEGCNSLDAHAVSMLLGLQEQLAGLGKHLELVRVPGALQSMFEGTLLVPNVETTANPVFLNIH